MNIYEKLLNVQVELKAPKGQFNKFGNYKYNDFKRVNNVKEATILFEKYYERAGVVALEERIKNAEEIYKKYS